jgi:hypothetical protein
MSECAELGKKLAAYVRPDDQLRDELNSIIAEIFRVGRKLPALVSPPRKAAQSENLQNPKGTPVEVLGKWLAFEQRLASAAESHLIANVSEEIAYLRAQATGAIEALSVLRAELDSITLGGNEVTARERATKFHALSASLAEMSTKLDAFRVKCVPPTEAETQFNEHFERIYQALFVRLKYVRVNESLVLVHEVPDSALFVPRTLAERRGAILQWLCVHYDQLHPLLPADVRRDRAGSATSGGRGHVNMALRGLAAALVLLELVDVPDGEPTIQGKKLFEKTVKRVDQWIREEAKSGAFFVDSGSDADEAHRPFRQRAGSGKPLEFLYPRIEET